MGDPDGALAHARSALGKDGAVMLVEPHAGDHVAENLHPSRRCPTRCPPLACTPASLAQDVGAALGAQAGEARLGAVAAQAGLTRLRRGTETPFNLVLDARP